MVQLRHVDDRLGLAGELRLEVCQVAGHGVHVPAGQVGRATPVVLVEAAQQGEHTVDALLPRRDEVLQAGLVRSHVGQRSHAPVTAAGVPPAQPAATYPSLLTG